MDGDFKIPPFEVEVQFVAQSEITDWWLAALGFPDLWAEFGMGENAVLGTADTGQPTHKDLIPAMGKAKDFTGSINGVRDVQGHATHVNGIVLAQHNDAATKGACPAARGINAKALGDGGSGSSTSVASAVRWLAEEGVDVMNLSLGSSQPSSVINEAIGSLPEEIIFVCAAGNSGREIFEYPAANERAISVAASNQERMIARFSTRNHEVDVAAPGERITSTWLNDQVATLNGTSMATPVVAAIAVMAKGYAKRFGFKLTHKAFYGLLTSTADDVSLPGRDIASGFGIVNPAKFFARLKALMPAVPVQPSPPSGRPWVIKIEGIGEKPVVT